MLVVTPNTCLDVTTWLGALTPGTVSRAARTVTVAGGKGVNVCRTLRVLGRAHRLLGLAPRDDDRLPTLLAAEGCAFVPVPHDGQGRLSLIFLEDDGRATVVNGSAPTPPPGTARRSCPPSRRRSSAHPPSPAPGRYRPGCRTTPTAGSSSWPTLAGSRPSSTARPPSSVPRSPSSRTS